MVYFLHAADVAVPFKIKTHSFSKLEKIKTTSIYINKNSIKQNNVTWYLITALFFGVSFVGIYYHEIWMDESHHFLLGRDSKSLLDVYINTRYDGHPILWNCLIYGITRFTENPFYMQLLHISISSFIALLFLKKAPFALWFKISFLLSYFMLYEYTLISRNYNLGILFLFLSVSLYSSRNSNFTTFCLFLALSCNTHAIFTLVASCLLFSVFLEHFFYEKTALISKYWKGYLIFLIGTSIAYYQIIPPSDTIFFDTINYFDIYEIFKSSLSLFKALFPIVDFTSLNYWNNFYFIEYFKSLSVITGIIVWILPLLFFNKNKYILLFVYATLISFITFEILTRRYGVRYNGLLFITIITGFWMLHSQRKIPLIKKKVSKFNIKIIVFLMLIQTIGGITAYILDIKYTFNNGKNVASYIINKKIDTNNIVTFCESASINAFLPKNLYNLAYQKRQGFYLWNKEIASFYNNTDKQIINLGFQKKTTKKELYFISYKTLSASSFPANKYSILTEKKFENAVKANYYIYLIQKNEY